MSELSGIRNENDLLNRLAEVERAVASLQRQNLRVGALSEMSADLGEFWGGDIFALESGVYPDDPSATGVFLSMNGYTIDGVTYRFGAVKNGHIVLGVTMEGIPVNSGGSGSLEQGVVLNGVLTILSQLATYGGYTRQMRLRMNLPNEDDIPGGNSIPAGSWEYREPAPSELLDNGTFDTDVDHWYGVTTKSSGYSGKYAEMMGALAPGVTNGSILCIEITPNGDIYVGGTFTKINGVDANRIAKYTKITGLWSALGTGAANGEVWGIAVDGTTVYVTGTFTSLGGVAVNYVGYYDGSWHAMGTGLAGGYGYCIDIDSSGNVIVGGTYTSAGGVANTQGIAFWAGAWFSLLGGTNGSVYSIRVDYGDRIWVGGLFTLAGSTPCKNLAMCDIADDWYGTCEPNGIVYDIAETWGGHIYVVGGFTDVDGITCNHIFHWDPFLWDWSQCGNGVGYYPRSVAAYREVRSYDDRIVVGGSMTNASGVECNGIVVYNRVKDQWENYYGDGLNGTCWVIESDPMCHNIVLGGQFSMVDNTATYVAYLCQAVSCDMVSITAGDHSPYDFSGYINNPKGKEFALVVQWLDASNVVLSSETVIQNALISTWKQYTRRLTKPDGAEKIQVVLRIINASDILFPNIGLDSFSLTEESADTYGIMLHPYPLAIIDSAIERIVSHSLYQLPPPRAPVIALLPTTWQPAEADAIDTVILSDNPTTNYGTAVTINAGEFSGMARICRTLIKPNFSTIPSDRTVSAAKLKLKIQGDYATNTRTLRAYALKVDFVETQATYNIRKTGTNWTTPGGFDPADCEQTDCGSVSIPHDTAVGTVVELELDPTVMNEFINGTKTYYGFLLKMDTESDDGWQFHSSSAAASADRPSLELTIVDACTNGSHKVKDVFVDAYGKSLGSAESNAVTVDAHNQLITGSVELGPFGTMQRQRFMTKAGGATYYLAKTIADNTTTTCVLGIPDASLTVELHTANTSGSRPLTRSQWSVLGPEVRTAVTMTQSTAFPQIYTVAANANNGDEYYFTFIADEGTYTLTYLLGNQTYFGIIDVYIDGVLVDSGIDTYAGSGGYDQYFETGVTITGNGLHLLMLKINGKNGSSTDYGIGIYSISGRKTSGVPYDG